MSSLPTVHAGDVLSLTHRGDVTKPTLYMIVHHPARCYLTLDRIAQHANTVCPDCVHRWWLTHVIAVHKWWPQGKATGQ